MWNSTGRNVVDEVFGRWLQSSIRQLYPKIKMAKLSLPAWSAPVPIAQQLAHRDPRKPHFLPVLLAQMNDILSVASKIRRGRSHAEDHGPSQAATRVERVSGHVSELTSRQARDRQPRPDILMPGQHQFRAHLLFGDRPKKEITSVREISPSQAHGDRFILENSEVKVW